TIPSASLPHAIRHQLLRKAAQPMNETMEVGSGAFGREPQLLTMQSYPVRYHRRMRSSELHYIDHPLVGILILVTPVEVDASELTE
ncbi:MAG: peptidoglycan binding protein CsiV, partial [Gammaproteobacteria bacterium]|nr:peptidoglycan binding protein CsiV [Gammaproteobacteria bacterium]